LLLPVARLALIVEAPVSERALADAAQEDFTAALNVDNRNADAWAGRGFAFEKLGKKAEASEAYQRALALDGNNAIARAGSSRISGGGGGFFRS